MSRRSRSINYETTFPNPEFTKDFGKAVKYELCVTLRLTEIEPKPNCNENRKDLIIRLKRDGIYKAIDLNGINSAKELRKSKKWHIIYI